MVFSLEMSKEQLVNRMLSMESNVDSQKLRTGTLTDSDWDAVVEGIGTIGSSKLIIDDTPGISISELRSKCRKGEAGVRFKPCHYRLFTADERQRKERREPPAGDLGDFPFTKGAGARAECAGYLPCRSFPVPARHVRTTARCFRICVSLVRLSRMPM